MLHLNPHTFFANLGGPQPTLRRLEAVPLKGFGPLPNTWLLLPWVCTENQFDRPRHLAGWTEFAGLDIEGQAKKRRWTLQDWTLVD